MLAFLFQIERGQMSDLLLLTVKNESAGESDRRTDWIVSGNRSEKEWIRIRNRIREGMESDKGLGRIGRDCQTGLFSGTGCGMGLAERVERYWM